MRKITAGLFISLDGVVEAPDQWHFPYFNEEMGAAVDATLGAADTVLFGRKTYDSFGGAWPEREAAGGEDAGFAKALGDARKSSCRTRSSSSPGGTPNSSRGDLVEGVTP
jgi:dihydrofolate reductase